MKKIKTNKQTKNKKNPKNTKKKTEYINISDQQMQKKPSLGTP